MKRQLLMKTMLLLLFALVVGTGSMWAETATITFSSQTSGTSDSGTAYTTSTFVSSGIASSSAAFGTITCTATAKCYSGKTGYGMKTGASSNAGSFTLAFSTPLTNVSQITLNRTSYASNKTTTITVKNGSTTLGSANTPASTDFSDMDITNLSINSLSGLTVQTGRYCYIKSITITYSSSSLPSAELAFAVPSFKVAADLANFPTPTLTNPHSVTGITYSSNDEDIAVVGENTGEILIGSKIGTATITATFAGNSTYAAGTATYTITTYNPAANDGSEAKPYTVAEALTKIAALADNGTIPGVYVKGKVHEVTKFNDSYNSINYYIEDLDDNTKTLYVYSGKGLGNTNFTAETDLTVGDEVMIYGALQKYVKNSTTTPEFTANNYIAQYKHGTDAEVKSLQVKAAEYATYVASANLIVPAGVKAYIATGESSTTLTLKSVAKIKEGTPVILNATAGYYSFEITSDEVTYPSANLLKISDGTTINGVFVLAKNGSDVGFYKWAGGALSPGKVYIDAPANPAREFLGFAFEDEDVTGINEAKGEKKAVEGIFDLQGRKVVTPAKGLYIVNGKKVIIK